LTHPRPCAKATPAGAVSRSNPKNTMAHKDNIKAAEGAAKTLLTPEPVEVVIAAPTLQERFGHHTGCVQLAPVVAKSA